MKLKLPTWTESDEARRAGVATDLQRFICNYEIAGPDAENWRDELRLAITHVVDHTKPWGRT